MRVLLAQLVAFVLFPAQNKLAANMVSTIRAITLDLIEIRKNLEGLSHCGSGKSANWTIILQNGEGASWLHLPIDREWAEERRRQLVRALSHELQFKRNLAQLLSVNLVSSS